MIHEIRVGKVVVRNVIASVAPVQAVPLLGQSFLSKLHGWHIDNDKHQLVLGDAVADGDAPYAGPVPQAGRAEPPPELWEAPQSLPQTLAFLRDSLAGQGLLRYSLKLHDAADGSDWSQSMTGEASNVTDDPARCALSYHWRTSSDGKQVQDFDTIWRFADGRGVNLITREEEIRAAAAHDGHPTWSAIVTPPIWVVQLTFTNMSGVANFTDRDTAERFSRAAERAMSICGRGAR
jgi:hypothetical protein